MHSNPPRLDLPELRRQLEEILALVGNSPDGGVSQIKHEASLLVHRDNVADEPSSCNQIEPEAADEPPPGEVDRANDRSDLYADALVVVTEFGYASIPILQMWLS